MIEDFKKGDHIIITKKPFSWSSILSYGYTLDGTLEFPYHCQIKKIKYDNESEHTAMTDGKFGWSLSSLIRDKHIVKDSTRNRKNKILKLNEISNENG